MHKRETIQKWKELFAATDAGPESRSLNRITHQSEESANLESELTLQELADLLDEYTVDFPDGQVIENTIDASLIHVPFTQKVPRSSVLKVKRLFRTVSLQTDYLAKWFWLFSVMLFLYGYLETMRGVNPYKTILFLAPMPFVLGVLELIRGVDAGMAEIEFACKTSLPQLILARFVIVGLYNITLNVTISLGLHWALGIDLWKELFFWMVPFTWVSSLMLFLAAKIRGRWLAPIGLALWGGGVITVLSNPKALLYLTSINNLLLMVFSLVGAVFLWSQVYFLYHSAERGLLAERGAFIEAAN